MFTANIKNKQSNPNGSLRVDVEFTDGVKTFTDSVTPQDSEGLTHFISGRLKELDFGKGTDLPMGEYVPPVKIDPTIDPKIQARVDWLAKVSRYARIKTFLVDTGVFSANEAGLDDLLGEIKKSFDTSYLSFI